MHLHTLLKPSNHSNSISCWTKVGRAPFNIIITALPVNAWLRLGISPIPDRADSRLLGVAWPKCHCFGRDYSYRQNDLKKHGITNGTWASESIFFKIPFWPTSCPVVCSHAHTHCNPSACSIMVFISGRHVICLGQESHRGASRLWWCGRLGEGCDWFNQKVTRPRRKLGSSKYSCVIVSLKNSCIFPKTLLLICLMFWSLVRASFILKLHINQLVKLSCQIFQIELKICRKSRTRSRDSPSLGWPRIIQHDWQWAGACVCVNVLT